MQGVIPGRSSAHPEVSQVHPEPPQEEGLPWAASVPSSAPLQAGRGTRGSLQSQAELRSRAPAEQGAGAAGAAPARCRARPKPTLAWSSRWGLAWGWRLCHPPASWVWPHFQRVLAPYGACFICSAAAREGGQAFIVCERRWDAGRERARVPRDAPSRGLPGLRGTNPRTVQPRNPMGGRPGGGLAAGPAPWRLRS